MLLLLLLLLDGSELALRLAAASELASTPALSLLLLRDGSELALGLAAASELPCTPASAASAPTVSLPELCAVAAGAAVAADAVELGAVFSPLAVRDDVLKHADDEMCAAATATTPRCGCVSGPKHRPGAFNALETRSGGGRARDRVAKASRVAIALSDNSGTCDAHCGAKFCLGTVHLG